MPFSKLRDFLPKHKYIDCIKGCILPTLNALLYIIHFFRVTPMTKKQSLEKFDKSIKDFRGMLPTLEAAIGAYIVGLKMGWKPLLLVHDKKTLQKYEQILGIDFRKEFPEVGDWANKSAAWQLSQKVSNYWKAVKGEIPGIRTPEITK